MRYINRLLGRNFMPLLNRNHKFQVWQEFMNENKDVLRIDKNKIYEAVVETDRLIEKYFDLDYDNSLPKLVKTKMTKTQKILILLIIIRKKLQLS